MTNKQINIAIAESRGWFKFTQFTTYPKSWGRTPARYHNPIWSLTSSTDMTEDECTKYGWHGDGHISIDHIPDYCNDLNAMHEAEKWMISNLRLLDFWQFAEELKRIVPANLGDDSYIHATARQRAEAFLKTIGKWEGAK
jgi:hypothetical protein